MSSLTPKVSFQSSGLMICQVLTESADEGLSLRCWSDAKDPILLKEELLQLIVDRVKTLSDGRVPVQRELLELWREEADDFFERLSELCSLFGVEVTSKSHVELLHGWRILHAAGILIPNIKYSVNVAYNRHFGDLEMPEEIQFDLGLKLFPKSLRVALGRMRSWAQRYKKMSLYLINTLFQGWKKGLLPLDIPAFDKTMMKHRKALCETDGSVDESTADHCFRIASELLKDFRCNRMESSNLLPSTSATIEYSKAQGGSYRALLDSYYLTKDSFFSLSLDRDYCRTLCGFVKNKTAVKEIRGYGPTMLELKQEEKLCWRDSVFDDLAVLPYGVLEPLKIRTITRPSFRTHWGLRGIQKRLLGFLNKWKTFEITGDSNKLHLSEHCQEVVENNQDELPMLVSGDFSAATDSVKAEITRVIWEVVGGKGMPWWIYTKGLNSLCSTKIIYDERCMPKIAPTSPYRHFVPHRNQETAPQTSGQLMGNILSFPILCIANYVAYHRAIELKYNREFSCWQLMNEFPVRINGDDILFRADDELYSLWKETTKSVGFNLSLGKNFAHREMFQINSQLFKVNYDILGRPCGSTRCTYFNFGQLTGRKKGMSSEDCRLMFNSGLDVDFRDHSERILELSSIHKNFSEMIEDAPSTLRKRCLELQRKWFDRRFKDLIRRDHYSTLFLPFEAGGLAFEGTPPSRKFESFDQCSHFFQVEGREEAGKYYPSQFAASMLTPSYTFRPGKKPLARVMDVCRSNDSEWIVDHCRGTVHSLHW